MTRGEIIQAAAQIFREKGYHAASMQDIADAVKLQKASLYYHVDSKQEILFSILEHALDLLIADMRAVVDSDLTTEEKLRLAMQVYMGRLADDADLSAVLLLEHRSLEDRFRVKHNRRRDRYENLWREMVREGIKRGEFRHIDPHIVTFALLGVQNWMITWFRQDGDLSSLEIADRFSDLFLEGLKTRESMSA